MPRNLSGVYTLPAGNPVVPGTTIDANWANSTLSDMANEITNSLSRTGAGGMLAPFRIDDGNVTGPGLSFLNETNTGYYRSGAGATAFSVLGVSTLQINTTSVTVPSNRTLNAQGNALVGGTFGVTGVAAFGSTLAVTGAITALGGVIGNVTAASGSSSFNDVTISGSLDMVAGSSATITGLSNPTNASDAANKGYVDTQDALKLSLSGGTMSGNIAMGNNLITGLGTAVSGGDATNKTYVDGQVATRLPLAGGTMSGAIAMSTNKITGLGTPTADTDAATKAYVDSVAQGLDVKGSVRAATTGNITLSGTQTIDGVAISAGDRVLVKDQSTAANNGIYVAAAGAWSRAADADTWNELVGAFVFVEDGTTNDNSGWVCTSPPGGTLGVTAVTFEQFSGAGQINAGTGMTKTGNTLNVNTASSSRIVVGADEIDLAQTGVTAGTYKSVTVDLYGRVTAGTNPTTLAGYGITDAYTQTQTDTLLNGKLSLTGGTMSGALAMGTSKITGLGNPTNAQDAATKTYVDTADALKLNLTGGTMSGAIAMGTNRITGLGDPVNAQDAATKNYIDTIFGSTSSAAASAAAAASSATAASTSATNAATSASNASTSATSAATSATNAATSLFNFRAQYLGPLASDPTVDGNGNAVTAGDLYWNTTVNETRIYNGTSWVAAYLPAAGYMDLTTNQTAAGVKTFSSNPILSGGTANGVAYLNGSKVLTTGSALTFDGTNLGVGLASPGCKVDVLAATNTSLAATVRVYSNNLAVNTAISYDGIQGSGDFYLGSTSNSPVIFKQSNAEAMRLTSTGLGIGTSSPVSKLDVRSGATTFGAQISTSGTNTYTPTGSTSLAAANLQILGGNASGACSGMRISHSGNFELFFGAVQEAGGAGAFVWQGYSGSAYAERMRLDSSGNLGIGTSSPALKLDVAFSSAGDGIRTYNTLSTGFADVRIGNNTNNNLGYLRVGGSAQGGISQDSLVIGTGGGFPIKIAPQNGSNGVTTFDVNGNFGLGVTPSAWTSTWRAFQIGGSSGHGGSVYTNAGGTTGQIGVGQNWYFNGSNNLYITSAAASDYYQFGGAHVWRTAASGTAGNAISFTQAMTLDASRNLGVGTTSPTDTNGFGRALDLNGPDGAAYYARTGGSGTNFTLFGNYGADGYILNRGAGNLYFYNNNAERARITSSGQFVVNGTAASSISTIYPASGSANTLTWRTTGNTAAGSLFAYSDGNGSAGGIGHNISINSGGGSSRFDSSAVGWSIWFDCRSGNQAMRFDYLNTGGGYSEFARFDISGRFLVGQSTYSTTTDGVALQASGSVFARSGTGSSTNINLCNGNGVVGTISTSGTSTSYNTSSDYRLKENQQPLTDSGAFIDALQPKTWNWKTDGSKGVGFIAHEVQEVSPGSVVGEKDAVDEEGNPIMQGMEYGSAEFIANIIAELQSLRQRVAALEAK